jgi:rubrerythrin
MASIKGTKTEKNLLKAFAGESQARNRYTYFSGQARKEGFVQIEALFLETAEQEKEHAKRFFKFLEGGAVEITAMYPAGKIATTAENLLAAAEGEHEEWTMLYNTFADTARSEGFSDVGAAFDAIASVEKEHEARYRKLLENVRNGKVFTKDAAVKWMCRNCGWKTTNTAAPEKCPACNHPQAYFEVAAENF